MIKFNDKEFYIEKRLAQNLDIMNQAIREDWDVIGLIDGYEGCGKSTLAFQICAYMDKTFNNSRVVFTPKEFTDAILKAEKYTAIVYDEARRGLNARRSMSEVNVALTNMLAEIRQKNLIVLIILPSFFDLDKNIACWRTKFLVHVYTNGYKERGFFKFYGQKRKKTLYMLGKKHYLYKYPPGFKGRFRGVNPLDEKAYRDLKAKHLKDFGSEQEKQVDEKVIKKIQSDEQIRWVKMLKEKGMTYTAIGEMLGVTRQAITNRLSEDRKRNATDISYNMSSGGRELDEEE